MKYSELYKKGNTYTALGLICEILDVRYSKTGRISAQVKNDKWGIFFTSPVNPDSKIKYLHASAKSVDSQD